MTQQIITTAKRLERPVTLYVFGVMVLLLAMSYIYLINGTVMHVVMRNSAEVEIATLTSSMGDLEGNYLALENSIDMAYANSLGFKEVKSDKAYVSLGSSVAGLSFNSGI